MYATYTTENVVIGTRFIFTYILAIQVTIDL